VLITGSVYTAGDARVLFSSGLGNRAAGNGTTGNGAAGGESGLGLAGHGDEFE
jgi:hypothetical protein